MRKGERAKVSPVSERNIMETNRKAKFAAVDDYYRVRWTLVSYEGSEDYSFAPGFEMPAEFVAEWAKAQKAVEALEDILAKKEKQVLKKEVQDAAMLVISYTNLLDQEEIEDILYTANQVAEYRAIHPDWNE